MKIIIGYRMSGYDNNSYMTGSCDKLFPELKSVPKCDACGYRTDYRYTNKDFKLSRKTLDVSSTYDGVTIVSLKFKEFCIRYGYSNLEFIALPKSPDFFQFHINGNILPFAASTKEDLCKWCNQYESIVGPSMITDNIKEPLPDGFYQSDLWFASRNEKSPVMVISPVTKDRMTREGFKNMCLNKIEVEI
ncbi:hypothetical protein D0T84_12955 [Dysgonomonas sp. 521]|uniref:hypothetical protein n=1 Tax=Dysgonomonas sp. 521 TaxID=2302932 RepID=UPI0013D2B587|nr:hypothetical protein [Dysgonomonas sp. 521]NDV95812.1 hypothetical protein [Dysgonomonas sp. 521]